MTPQPLKEAVKNLEVPAIVLGKPPPSPRSELEILTPASSMLGRFHKTRRVTKRPDSAQAYGDTRMAKTMKHDHTGLSTTMAKLCAQFESTEKTKKDSRQRADSYESSEVFSASRSIGSRKNLKLQRCRSHEKVLEKLHKISSSS